MKEQGKRGGLHIRLSNVFITLILRSPGLKIQRFSYLIHCTLTLTRSKNKFHFFGVSAFILGLLALVYVVEAGLEIDVLLKFLSQHHQNLMQIPQGIDMTLLLALLLGLGHPFSRRGRFSLGLCECLL